MAPLPLNRLDLIPFIVLSMVVYVAHIPGLGYLRIDAVALTVILFSVYRPWGLSLLVIFCIGLLQDVVSMAPFGQHALGLCVMSYIAQHMRDQIRILSIPKQLPSIAIALLVLKLIYSWVAAYRFGVVPSYAALLSILLTVLLWPVVYWFGQCISRNRRIPGLG